MKFSTRIYWAIVNVPFNEGMWYGTSHKYTSKPVQFFHDSILAIYAALTGSIRYVNTSERIIELPFIVQNIGLDRGAKILDLGCDESKLSIELASLGYRVTGVDLNHYPFSHPNFTFIRGNFFEIDFKEETFDVAIALSTIEHCGLGAYREERFEQGDQQIVDKIFSVLKRGGEFLFTTPFGKRAVTPHQRIYDEEQLQDLLRKFRVRKWEYYGTKDLKHWGPVHKEELAQIDCRTGYVKGVVCCVCEKS